MRPTKIKVLAVTAAVTVMFTGCMTENANVKIVLDEVEALQLALDESVRGDTIIVFFEELSPLVNLIKSNQENDENLGNVVNSN